MQVLQVNTAGNTTVLEAVKVSHQVTTGFVCTSANDIQCVDGLCNNPSQHKYWTIEVNGDFEDYNSMSKVGPQDKVVLKFSKLHEK